MDIPIIYKYWQFKIAENANEFKEIHKDPLMDFLGKYRIPNKLKPIIIQEMEDLKLIRRIPDRIKVINLRLKTKMEKLKTTCGRRRSFIDGLV